MAKIIVVEDNKGIREGVISYLELENHIVYAFDKIEGVYEVLENKDIDLIILDVMLPDGDGFSLARKIRKNFDIPIMFLTAKTSESDRITGFEIGGDDYMVKPFSPREMILRVKSILKRTKTKTPEKQLFIFENNLSILKLNTTRHKIEINDIEIYLTPTEWKILHFLILNAGNVLTREKLAGECLDYFYEGSDRIIDTHVTKIRSKIGETPWIETVWGYGYKFSGEEIEQPSL